MIGGGSIARRYAKALLTIGVDRNEFEKYGSDLDKIAQTMANAELAGYLSTPTYGAAVKAAVLKDVLSKLHVSEVVTNLCLMLLERNRIQLVAGVSREFQRLADLQAGRLRAEVVSARALQPQQVNQIQTQLEKLTGKQVILSAKTDATLIGGMQTKIGSVVYDGSVQASLASLRKTLLAE